MRNEAVRLTLQDDFTTPMAKAAAAAALLNRELNSLSGQSTVTSRASQSIARDTDAIAKSANRADSSINQLTGRLRLFADVAAILGPALLPVGAVALPAVTGLANQLGVAALAGGTAIVAFQGIGDALKAVNDAALLPTTENLAKAKTALEGLSPAAQEMVLRLQELRPVLDGLRDAAADGLMPGLVESLDDLQTRVPELELILTNMGTALGDLAADSAESFASDRWTDFFDYMATDAPQTLTGLGKTVGALAHGLSELWVAFDPLNDDFSTWMLEAAQGFDSWAEGLSQTQGFAEFVDYVRTNGPQVADTFAAMADAVLEIAVAAAPLGGTVLQALEALAKVVGAIADSNLGTPIMAAVTAMALLSRATRTYQALAGTTWGSTARGNITGMVGALTTVTSAQDRARLSASQLAKAEADRSAAAQRGVVTLGKAALGVSALAVASSGAAEGIGLTNTVTLGLLGTMAGPWGSVLGAAAGVTLDAAAANNDLADSFKQVSTAMSENPAAFEASSTAIDRQREQLEEFAASVDRADYSNMLNPAAWKNFGEELFGDSDLEELEAELAAVERQAAANRQTFSDLGNVLQGNTIWKDYTDDVGELGRIATSVQPAMDALGYTVEELQVMERWNPVGFAVAGAQIRAFIESADSVKGRTVGVADAIKGLGDANLTTAQSADALSEALDRLLSPQMGLSEATDAFQGALRGLDEELAQGSRSLRGFGDGAIQNREAIRGLASNLQNLIVTQAAAGDGPRKLARSLAKGRGDIIEFGRAAGLSEKGLRGFLNQIGLTPRLVRVVLRAQGMDKATTDAFLLRRQYQSLPKVVRTAIRTNGVPKTRGELKDLEDKAGNLTKREKRILMTLKAEAARRGITDIDKLLERVGKKKAEPKIGADAKPFNGSANAVESQLKAIDRRRVDPTVDLNKNPFDAGISNANAALTNFGSRSESATITTTHRNIYVTERRKNADGNIHEFYAHGGVRDQLPRIGDQLPQVRPYTGPAGITWSEEGSGPWEGFVSGHPAKRSRSRSITEEIAERLGGRVEWMFANGGLMERAYAGRPFPSPQGRTSAPVAMSVSLPPVTAVLTDRDVQRIANAVFEGASAGVDANQRALNAAMRTGGRH